MPPTQPKLIRSAPITARKVAVSVQPAVEQLHAQDGRNPLSGELNIREGSVAWVEVKRIRYGGRRSLDEHDSPRVGVNRQSGWNRRLACSHDNSYFCTGRDVDILHPDAVITREVHSRGRQRRDSLDEGVCDDGSGNKSRGGAGLDSSRHGNGRHGSIDADSRAH